jgi:hypothetical protein
LQRRRGMRDITMEHQHGASLAAALVDETSHRLIVECREQVASRRLRVTKVALKVISASMQSVSASSARIFAPL